MTVRVSISSSQRRSGSKGALLRRRAQVGRHGAPWYARPGRPSVKRRTAATLAGLTFALVALTAAAHPLDPLSEDEIQLAVALMRADKGFPEGALFPSVVLAEPKKD